MKKLLPVLILILWPHTATVASAQCAGRESIPSAFAGSTFVFSGRVVWLDQIIARIQVDKMWKGEDRSEIVMRTGTLVTAGGFMSVSERLTYSVGQQYVIYASGSLDQLNARDCSHSGLLVDSEVAALDAITPHRKIGMEIHRCAATAAAAAGEIRVAVSSSSEVPMPGVRVTLDGSARRDGARTDNGGHVLFTGLPPGEYKVTADLDGHTPKQATVNVPEKTCMEAALFLSPR
jgi:hypothetical protein